MNPPREEVTTQSLAMLGLAERQRAARLEEPSLRVVPPESDEGP